MTSFAPIVIESYNKLKQAFKDNEEKEKHKDYMYYVIAEVLEDAMDMGYMKAEEDHNIPEDKRNNWC